MKLFALIGGENEVIGLVKLDDDSMLAQLGGMFAQMVDVTDVTPQPQLGWQFDGQNVVGTSAVKRITKLAMRSRFTFNELVAITSSTNPMIKVLMDNLSTASFIDLSRADTVQGVGLLMQLGLLTPERGAAILSAPVAIHEQYIEGTRT